MAVSEYTENALDLTNPEHMALALEGYRVLRPKDHKYVLAVNGDRGWYFGNVAQVLFAHRRNWAHVDWWSLDVDP